MSKKIKRILIPVCILLALVLSFFIYVGIYYHADEYALKSITESVQGIEKNTVKIPGTSHEALVFEPTDEATVGFIFYPGAKVEYTSYAPLMEALAGRGILCIDVKMPFNMAIFDKDAAEDFKSLYPNITSWYIGGHSLGGATACYYLEDNSDEYDGLILLAAYSAVDLSNTKVKTLCIYGSEDKVLNLSTYQKNKNMLSNLTEYIIDGGCHAYFGSYGPQKGDGTPTISVEEQTEITAGHIAEFVR